MATIPYIGSRISLISNSEIRYEGVLYTINTNESTIALQSVKSFGTEGRKHPEVQATNEVYDFIIFRGKDIKDLTVLEGGNKSSPALQDPAIVQVKNAKSSSTFPVGKGSGKGAAPGAANGKGWNSNNWQQPQQWEQGQRNWQQNQSNSYNGPQQNWGQPYNGSGQWDGWTQGQDYTQNWNQGYGKGKGKGARNSYTANWEQGAEWKGRGDQSGRLYNRGRNNPVGELVPNENKVAKAAVEKDFDLTEANAKFEKVSADSKEETQLGSYDKTKSFFDSISCEAIERAKGPTDRPDAKKIRETDRSTFGDATVNSHRFGGRGRGKGYKGAGRGKGVKGGKGYGGKGRAF